MPRTVRVGKRRLRVPTFGEQRAAIAAVKAAGFTEHSAGGLGTHYYRNADGEMVRLGTGDAGWDITLPNRSHASSGVCGKRFSSLHTEMRKRRERKR